jgi:hypothetical protein
MVTRRQYVYNNQKVTKFIVSILKTDINLIIPKLNPRLCRGEWQKLCLSIYTNNLLLYIALLECLKICNIAEGGRDEKKFITYSMGLQVSYCLGPQEATQDSVW